MRLFRKCEHLSTRCLHGDEIMARMKIYMFRFWKEDVICRQVCLTCRRALDRTAICTRYPGKHAWTGEWSEDA